MNVLLSETAKRIVPETPVTMLLKTNENASSLESDEAESEEEETCTEIIEFFFGLKGLVNRTDYLLNFRSIDNFKLHEANLRASPNASHYGILHLRTETNMLIEFKNVFYVKKLPCD